MIFNYQELLLQGSHVLHQGIEKGLAIYQVKWHKVLSALLQASFRKQMVFELRYF